ncbi:single-stranded-DNA-specific exonuclease RecJ [Candidatus Curtissbacteria bacterium]|nr:single-stranded-DNA-specific exonuclease RecJ [Candidatus Curtissbacteria bacterium]
MIKRDWKIKSKVAKKSKSWLLDILAKNRGLNSSSKLKGFLNPTIDQILDIQPTNLQSGVKRIEAAIKKGEKIIVYSDYDADGMCGTAIMWETLNDLSANVLPYIPHRIREGYGLSNGAISELAEQKVNLIITVDHGVTAVSQVEHARKLGVDVVITDHHVMPARRPKPTAMVHSVDLCGAGVAWRLCFEIVKKLKPDYKDTLTGKLELAALATIADLVPLIGGSRAIVKLGLEILSKTKRPGLLALIRSAGINGKIGTYEIGHILAPRINAMGRIEHGMDALRLLCTKSKSQAHDLAEVLSRTNSKRQDLTVSAVNSALSMVESDQLVGVVSHEAWHEGVIGLVASRLVEQYWRPMIAISKGEVYSKGSARSIPGFNIVEAIRSSSEYLVDAGGHPMAAGFTIETRHIEVFSAQINKYAASRITNELLTPKLEIECELEKEDINHKTLDEISQFEPYGMANPQPIFLTRNLMVEDVRTVGADNKHLKLQVDGFGAIGFNMGEKKAEIRPGYLVDLVYTLAEDKYNGNGSLQLKIKDLAINN